MTKNCTPITDIARMHKIKYQSKINTHKSSLTTKLY